MLSHHPKRGSEVSRIDVRCDLSYEVRCPAVYPFLIANARTDHQRIEWEQLTFGPKQVVGCSGQQEDDRSLNAMRFGIGAVDVLADPVQVFDAD